MTRYDLRIFGADESSLATFWNYNVNFHNRTTKCHHEEQEESKYNGTADVQELIHEPEDFVVGKSFWTKMCTNSLLWISLNSFASACSWMTVISFCFILVRTSAQNWLLSLELASFRSWMYSLISNTKPFANIQNPVIRIRVQINNPHVGKSAADWSRTETV